jgi:hypothetical protein
MNNLLTIDKIVTVVVVIIIMDIFRTGSETHLEAIQIR